MTVTEGEPTAPTAPEPPPPGWEPPAPLPRTTRPRWVAPAATGAALVAGCAAIALWDPGDGGVAVCWSKALFGIDCPLCGGLRATNALTRGDWFAAADHNVLVAVGLPLLAVLWAVWLIRSIQGRPLDLPRIPRAAVIGFGVFLLAFAVVRNLDVDVTWIHWLASDTA
ncbi:MAG TPA: DUF2752 domain-containing protein [Microthrixaceae bacterium]|nr:DUF2752 domain-containing protein [Microthrixaceae bacterium]